ncbi:MAG: hypothetical protein AB2689_06035 [Candidatus Thiodiazotropha taylori]
MLRTISIILAVSVFGGCTTVKDADISLLETSLCSVEDINPSLYENKDTVEKGLIWCNTPFLRKRPKLDTMLGKGFDIANEGYIPALAGALVLQDIESLKEGYLPLHYFPKPKRLVRLDNACVNNGKNGFQARVYELRREDSFDEIEAVIIAFSGTNDFDDWKSNLFGIYGQKHYKAARDYLIKYANIYRRDGVKVIVTGYSLGGGLVVHVMNHEETESLVDEGWAFNASPHTYLGFKKLPLNSKLYSAYHENEILSVARWLLSPLYNYSRIPSTDIKTFDNVNLIDANPFYGHSRWVLARQFLHIADAAKYLEGTAEQNELTEPMKILDKSSSVGCDEEKLERTLQQWQ